MSRSGRRADRRGRRSVLGVGTAAGAAFAAALIGLANAPAARADKPEPFQDLPQHRGIPRKFAAELDPLVSRFPRLGEAAVERNVAPQFRHIVIAPADGAAITLLIYHYL